MIGSGPNRGTGKQTNLGETQKRHIVTDTLVSTTTLMPENRADEKGVERNVHTASKVQMTAEGGGEAVATKAILDTVNTTQRTALSSTRHFSKARWSRKKAPAPSAVKSPRHTLERPKMSPRSPASCSYSKDTPAPSRRLCGQTLLRRWRPCRP